MTLWNVPKTTLLSLLALSGSAWAGGPFSLDDAGTLGQGTGEAEVNWSAALDSMNPSGVDMGVAAHVGVLDSVDIGVGTEMARFSRAMDDFGDTTTAPGVDVKWAFGGDSGPGLALRADFGLPVGTPDAVPAYGLTFLPTWETDRLGVAVNVGAGAEDLDTLAANWGVGVGFGLAERVALVGEIFGEYAVSDSGVGVGWSGGFEVNALGDAVLAMGGGGAWAPGDDAEWMGAVALALPFGRGYDE